MSGIFDSFQESTDHSLDIMAQGPLDPVQPEPKHSAWTAPLRGIGSASLEVGANFLDITRAYAKSVTAYGAPSASPFGQSEEEKAQSKAMRERLQGGEDLFNDPHASELYSLSTTLAPDPQSAGVAENLVYGLSRGLSKAVGSVATFGPVAGPVLFGTSEGMTSAERLKQQGVDKATRTKAALVTGGVSAAMVSVPVAGQTVAQTAGLVALSGPASFMAEQQANKKILENANYEEIAKQYDPLDPVGLAVATLLPTAFGVHGLRVNTRLAKTPLPQIPLAERQNLRYNSPQLDSYATQVEQQYGLPPGILTAIKNAGEKSGNQSVSPAGARGVMQFMPENLRKYGVTDPTDPMQMIDAAGRYLSDTAKQYGGNVDAMIADYNGGPKQANAVLRGETPASAETRAYLERVKAHMGKKAPDVPILNPTRDQIDAAMVHNLTLQANMHDSVEPLAGLVHIVAPEIPTIEAARFSAADAVLNEARPILLADAGNMLDAGQITQIKTELNSLAKTADFLQSPQALKQEIRALQDTGLKRSQAEAKAQKSLDAKITDVQSQVERLTAQVDRNGQATRASQELALLDKGIVPERLTPLVEQRAQKIVKGFQEKAIARLIKQQTPEIIQEPRSPIESQPAAKAVPAEPAQAVKTPAKAEPAKNPAPPEANAAPAEQAGRVTVQDNARGETVVKENPDLPVDVTENGKVMTAADKMAEIRKLAQEGTDTELGAMDAKLLQAAAECLLSA